MNQVKPKPRIELGPSVALRNELFMAYYLCWFALGKSDSQAEWDAMNYHLTRMEECYGYAYLGDIINLCED